MNIKILFDMASIIASMCVVMVAYILIPEQEWSVSLIFSLIGLAFSVGYLFYIPPLILKRGQSNSGQLSSIGLIGFIGLVTVLIMSASFIFNLEGMDKLGGAVFVFGVCSFLIMTIILNVSLKMVENISENTPKRSDREKWQLQIIDSKTISKNAETIKSLDVLEEKIRYSADDINNGCPQNKEIVDILDAIKLQIEFNPDAMVDELIKKIDSLLVNRDTYLKISR